MRVLSDKTDGDLDVTSDLKVTGLVSGNVTVTGEAWLDLYGTIAGNLTVARNASAQVFGSVAGTVEVEGFASIDGVVGGAVRRHHGGELFIGGEARIAGGVAEPPSH